MMTPEQLVFSYFRSRNLPVPASAEEAGTVRYIELGWVDSVGILEFVSYLEERTKVSFTDDDLTSDEFHTLKGVAEILRRRAAG